MSGEGVSRPTALLVGYDPDLPSFRHRLLAVVPELERRGWRVAVERFDRGRYFRRILVRRDTFRSADLVVLSKVNMSAAEAALLRRYARRLVLDFDDAIYIRKPRRVGDAPDTSSWRRRKFEAVCRRADAVIAGNETLAAAARPHARAVHVVPTPVACEPLPAPAAASTPGVSGDAVATDEPTIVWIGMPENVGYLETVRPALAALTRRFPGLRLRVVSSEFPDWNDVNVERVRWQPGIEREVLPGATAGIMPLADDEWTRGKCAFKLLQYMAAAVPCVASPVGANTDVVVPGSTGYLASATEEWIEALGALLADSDLQSRLGAAAREEVERRFDVRVVAPKMADALLSVV